MQEFSPPSRVAKSAAVPAAGRVSVLFILIALTCCAIVLAGWSFGNPALAELGSEGYAMQPLTATALIFVAFAQFASMRRRVVLVVAPLCIPIAIATTALFVQLSGICIIPGLDVWLFGEKVPLQRIADPGRPGAMPAIAALLLVAATLISLGARRHHGQLVVLLASLALGVSVVAAASAALGLDVAEGGSRYAAMSIPTATSVVCLSMALITWRQYFGWHGLFSTHGVEGRTLRTIFALCVLAPLAFALARLWALHHTGLSLHLAEVLHASAQITVSAAILMWAWSRIARENAARWAVTRALDSAPIILADIEGRIIHWSEGCERLYAWTAKDAIGRSKRDLVGEGTPERWDALMERLRTGLRWEEEVTEFRRDGARLHILEHARLLQPHHDDAPVVVLSMIDVTARKHAEEELRVSDARLALAVEALEIGVFEWDVTPNQVRLSGNAERLLGPGSYPPGLRNWREHVRRHFDSEIFPDAHELAIRNLPRFSFRLRSKGDGKRARTIEGWARRIHSDEGRLTRMIGIMFDATEREEREAALQARESELRSILETVPDAMVTIDELGNIRSFSATAEALFGYGAQELLGRNITLLMPERYRKQHEELFARYLDTGEAYLIGRTRTMIVLHRDGTEIPVELAVGEAHNGRERVFIGFVRNLHEQIAAQARLDELRDQLLHVSRLSAMGEMAAGLAHELNQPLAATSNFLGAADMLLTEEETRREHVRDLVQLASGQVLRAGNIIRRVRNFVAKGEVEIGVEPLAEIVSDAVHLVLAGAPREKVEIRYALDPAYPLVLADRVQVQQVLVNIVRNALEALREGGADPAAIVLASQGGPDGMVTVTVCDNGPGIAPDILERPFEPFVSTKAYGMGVGLSICRRIIESHGGSFTAENKPAGGARIRFTLPVGTQLELVTG